MQILRANTDHHGVVGVREPSDLSATAEPGKEPGTVAPEEGGRSPIKEPKRTTEAETGGRAEPGTTLLE